MATRDLRIDGLKFFLVCMVVLGHCIQPFRYDYAVTGWLYGIIYSFHMPLFIILSGYFFRVEAIEKETKKCLRLLETFIIVTLVYWLSSGMSYTWPLVRIGACPSWYLFSLLCWRITSFYVLRRMAFQRLFTISLLLSIILFVTLNKGEGVFGIMRTAQFYPYFLLGYAIKQDMFKISSFNQILVYILAVLSIIAIMFLSSYALYSLEFQSIGMLRWSKMFGMSVLCAVGGFLFVKISSLTISYSVWKFIKLPNSIALFGSASLLIYSLHTMILPLMYKYCTSLWQTLIIGLLTIVLAMALSKTNLSNLITNTFTTVLSIINSKKS